jgi:hypothetical protein
MNTDSFTRQFIENVTNSLLTCRRENIRTLARVKALEGMVSDSIPAAKRKAWNELLKQQTKVWHQKLLVSLENQNPGAAASFDDRKGWEIDDTI